MASTHTLAGVQSAWTAALTVEAAVAVIEITAPRPKLVEVDFRDVVTAFLVVDSLMVAEPLGAAFTFAVTVDATFLSATFTFAVAAGLGALEMMAFLFLLLLPMIGMFSLYPGVVGDRQLVVTR